MAQAFIGAFTERTLWSLNGADNYSGKPRMPPWVAYRPIYPPHLQRNDSLRQTSTFRTNTPAYIPADNPDDSQ